MIVFLAGVGLLNVALDYHNLQTNHAAEFDVHRLDLSPRLLSAALQRNLQAETVLWIAEAVSRTLTNVQAAVFTSAFS